MLEELEKITAAMNRAAEVMLDAQQKLIAAAEFAKRQSALIECLKIENSDLRSELMRLK